MVPTFAFVKDLYTDNNAGISFLRTNMQVKIPIFYAGTPKRAPRKLHTSVILNVIKLPSKQC